MPWRWAVLMSNVLLQCFEKANDCYRLRLCSDADSHGSHAALKRVCYVISWCVTIGTCIAISTDCLSRD